MPKSFLLKRLSPQAEPQVFSPPASAPINSEPPQLTLQASESFAFYNFNFAPSTPYRPGVRAYQSSVHDLNNNRFEASPYNGINSFLSPFHDAKFPTTHTALQISGKNYHERLQSSTMAVKSPNWGLRMGETLKSEMGERKGNLNKIQSVNSEKPQYKCDQCEKTFKTKYTLAIHLRMPSHTGARPFVCSICGKGFRLSSTLCRHKIIHTTAKPYKCSVCNKAFNRSSTLKTHMRTHSDVKEFLCQVCGKGFHQKGNLRNHVLIHTGEKPHKCKLCEKAFNKLSNLKFHMHVHTDNSPYRCRFCKVSFSRRCDLKIHVENAHHTIKE